MCRPWLQNALYQVELGQQTAAQLASEAAALAQRLAEVEQVRPLLRPPLCVQPLR
jgi:hypothetical protein